MKIKSTLKSELKKIMLKKIEDESKKIIIESADKLSDEQLNMLLEKLYFLKNKNIQFLINKNLLAGLIIKQGTSVLDLSLLSQMLEIKKELNEIS
jgi:F0F1-type ATP synthase delta subunit